MKIEINLDIEAIVREAIRNNASTNSVVVTTTSNKRPHKSLPNVNWEFGPTPGRRRNTEEIAMHDLELKYGRLLTPEEKGEAKALVEIDETAENKAKEDTIKKPHIDSITAERMAAASKELAEQKEEQDWAGSYKLTAKPEEKEATIPKAEELKTDSLFGN